MVRPKKKYELRKVIPAICMLLALAWLTISSPFVYGAQQKILTEKKASCDRSSLLDSEDAGCNPFSNTTEEKTESGVNTLSEYLHHIVEQLHPEASSLEHNRCDTYDVYVAFHGELLSPPPELSSIL